MANTKPGSEVLTVRLPAKLAKLVDEAAALRDTTRADWTRATIEFSATLMMWLEARDPVLQKKLGKKKAAQFEAELDEALEARFRVAFGRELPDDLLQRFMAERAEKVEA